MSDSTASAKRVAAIYAIHGNLPALEAVLEDMRRAGVDQVVIGGDVIPGPMIGETLAAVLDLGLPTHFIRGNGEREALAMLGGVETGAVPEPFREAMRWVGQQLQDEQVSVLERWPLTLRLGIDGLGDVLFCHATPRNDFENFTRLTPEDRLLPIFEPADAGLIICGHTHMQFDRRVGGTRVVNAGSVGMPFEPPGAYWLLLGPGVELRHTPYDLAAAAQRIRTTDYPQAEEFAADNVLETPSESAMLEIFERAGS